MGLSQEEGGSVLQFFGLELDEKRSELRRLDGETIKLRPKKSGQRPTSK